MRKIKINNSEFDGPTEKGEPATKYGILLIDGPDLYINGSKFRGQSEAHIKAQSLKALQSEFLAAITTSDLNSEAKKKIVSLVADLPKANSIAERKTIAEKILSIGGSFASIAGLIKEIL